MSRVFVVQLQERWDGNRMVPRHDLSPAEKFGEFHYLLSPNANAFNPEKVIAEMDEKLQDFCDDDYLLLLGNPCLIGWAVAIAADANEGRTKCLVWSKNDTGYIVVESTLP